MRTSYLKEMNPVIPIITSEKGLKDLFCPQWLQLRSRQLMTHMITFQIRDGSSECGTETRKKGLPLATVGLPVKLQPAKSSRS